METKQPQREVLQRYFWPACLHRWRLLAHHLSKSFPQKDRNETEAPGKQYKYQIVRYLLFSIDILCNYFSFSASLHDLREPSHFRQNLKPPNDHLVKTEEVSVCTEFNRVEGLSKAIFWSKPLRTVEFFLWCHSFLNHVRKQELSKFMLFTIAQKSAPTYAVRLKSFYFRMTLYHY